MTAADLRVRIESAPKVKPEPPRPLRRELPPADAFPVTALGNVLGPAAEAIHDKIKAPLAICAQAVLGAAALAVQGHADVVLPTRQTRPCSLFLVSVAASGERKTSADQEALWPVRQREAILRDGHGAALVQYKNAYDAHDQGRRSILSSHKDDPAALARALDDLDPPPVPPAEPMLLVPEPTLEGLHRYFAVGQPALGLFSTEGGQMVGGYGMSPDHRLKTAAGLSALWDGEPIRRMRASDGATVLPGRRLSMHLMVQPGVASELLSDARLADQGLLSRLLVQAPETAAGRRLWRDPKPESDAALKRYGARLLSILETPLPVRSADDLALAPRPLSLSGLARRAWIAFHDHIERQLGSGGDLEPIRAFSAKLPEHAVRLAAVRALVEDLDASEVSGAAMAAGIDLAQHYASEALRLFEAGRTDPDLALAERALEWLRTRWSEPAISLPDLYQRGPNAIRDTKTARRIIAVLQEHGWLLDIEGGAEVNGVHRRAAWRIVRKA